MAVLDRMYPLLHPAALAGEYTLPPEQPVANAALIAVFAYLVPLLTMEINFFRLAAYRSRRRGVRRRERKLAAEAADDGAGGGEEAVKTERSEGCLSSHDDGQSVCTESVVGHLVNDVANALHDTVHSTSPPDDPTLQHAYASIRRASMQAILSSLVVYSLTALGIAWNTRGLDPKAIAVLVGTSQFLAALMVFIVSAKVPQWIGVYHEGAIRLVKCSSNYSEKFQTMDLDDDDVLRQLRSNVRLGVGFHFSKFFIVLMPFYCGVREGTIPLSILVGAAVGFILMWAVFVVHEKYIRHRNVVSFTTILLLSIISSLAFVRGMAWIQAVWKLDILRDEDVLLTISFFSWLALLAVVHSLFLWQTLRTEKQEETEQLGGGEVSDADGVGESQRTPAMGGVAMRRNSSYSSFVFDPRTHFKDGKCQFTDHPDLEEDFTMESTDAPPSTDQPPSTLDGAGGDDEEFYIETPIVAGGVVVEIKDNMDDADRSDSESDDGERKQPGVTKKRRCPSWCHVFVCYSPEYQKSSCFWKIIIWIKIAVITLAYLLCLYFVIVCIGATYQINTTKAALPAVHEILYGRMNEGEVCAFDNRGPESNITTFESKDAAHAAGFLVVHCGACGACSSWENLIIEWTTRDTMAALANQCAKEALFGGGDDAITECLMKPEIGFEHECALCWQEDILCTKDHCAFIFLQSQMINNVGNFAVGPSEVTSATCEEAHCEVGQFVPCSGATRRRMNIVSSISRPGDQQCNIVDVEDWEDLFFGSGVA